MTSWVQEFFPVKKIKIVQAHVLFVYQFDIRENFGGQARHGGFRCTVVPSNIEENTPESKQKHYDSKGLQPREDFLCTFS